METGSVESEEEKENLGSVGRSRRGSNVRMGTRVLAREAVVPPAHLAQEVVPWLPGLVDVSLRPPVFAEPREPGMDESLSMVSRMTLLM